MKLYTGIIVRCEGNLAVSWLEGGHLGGDPFSLTHFIEAGDIAGVLIVTWRNRFVTAGEFRHKHMEEELKRLTDNCCYTRLQISDLKEGQHVVVMA